MKVSDLAKKLGTSTKETISLLKDMNVLVKTASSVVPLEAADTLLKLATEVDTESKPKKDTDLKTENIDEKKEKKITANTSDTKKKLKKDAEETEAEYVKIIALNNDCITTKILSDLSGIKISELIKEGLKKGFMLNLNQEIDIELASELLLPFNILIDREKSERFQIVGQMDKQDPKDIANLKSRAPIVTIMGHVDHGKTKLLDTIRSSNVIDSEAGGITQHIGAYQVVKNGKPVTFIDTPGHSAFTTLRARGAKVTDIVIIVVAADDGIMPQTIEAIDHAKAANVPIIVAINKIDKEDANIDRVRQQLVEHDLTPEDWGGKTITVPISAKGNIGIDELLEMILLVAEIQELKANPNKLATGIVIESHLSKNRGPVITCLVKEGTLKIGDFIVAGSAIGKVRAMFNDIGHKIKNAPPSFPVEILGLSETPLSGSILRAFADEKTAKITVQKTRELEKQERFRTPIKLEDFSKVVQEQKNKNLNVILKTDVRGSLEALINSLHKIKVKDISVQVLHQGVGNVNESDVMLASASNAVVFAFSVDIGPDATKLAEETGVDIRQYQIIYKLLDDIELAMVGMLAPEYEEVEIGKVEVRDTFAFSKVGTIAGCFVLDGKIIKGSSVNIFRKEKLIFQGKINSLKRFKDDVKEVQKNFECGVVIDDFKDFQSGDLLVILERRIKTKK